ncbi:glycosyltransferase, partial [Streptococcus anginosus]|nr:glycosyltransferase [Streptococcus anginosus]
KKLDRIFGLRVIHMPKNGGFIRACNTGLQHARGEIVIYLNNDTEVSPTWLIPIVERMEDPSIGLVGARLVYADGTLQEAGGVVFADGVTENYGNGNNPENHSYTYFRDVDY